MSDCLLQGVHPFSTWQENSKQPHAAAKHGSCRSAIETVVKGRKLKELPNISKISKLNKYN